MIIFVKLRLCNTKCSKLNQETNKPKPTIQSSRKIFQELLPPSFTISLPLICCTWWERSSSPVITIRWGELCSRSTSFFPPEYFLFPYLLSLPNDQPFCLTNASLTFLRPSKTTLNHSFAPTSLPLSLSLSLTSMKKHLNQCPASPPNQSAPSKFNTVLFWIYESDHLLFPSAVWPTDP